MTVLTPRTGQGLAMKLTDRQRRKVFVMPSLYGLACSQPPTGRGLAYVTLLQQVVLELIAPGVAVSFNAGNFVSR